MVEDPAAIAGNAGVGTFWFNEVVLGEEFLDKSRVRTGIKKGVLQIGQENGKFFVGEKIIGQSSGAIYILDKYMLLSEVHLQQGSVQNIDNYDRNSLFEGEANMILNFTKLTHLVKFNVRKSITTTEIMRRPLYLLEHCSIKFILSIMMDRRSMLLMK